MPPPPPPSPPTFAEGVEATWLSFGRLTAYNDDIASSHSGATFPTPPTDDTELSDSVSAPADGRPPPSPCTSSGLDEAEDSGIGLNISVVESAASGTLLTAVALSSSSPLSSSLSTSAAKRIHRFFRLRHQIIISMHCDITQWRTRFMKLTADARTHIRFIALFQAQVLEIHSVF